MAKQPIKQVIKGLNLKLTLDSNWQKLAYNLLSDKTGSIAVFDLDSGEVRVLVSRPSYDPNVFNSRQIDEISHALEAPNQPLLFRATQGMYPPGSVVKILSAILASKHLDVASFTDFCSGGKTVGKKFLNCHKRSGHGEVNLIKAIRESCDTYFYSLSQRLDYSDFFGGYKSLGLMDKFEFPLPLRHGFILPPEKVKNRFLEAALISIGQGSFAISPFKLGMLVNVMATDGKVLKPIIVKEILDQKGRVNFEAKPEILWNVNISKALKEQIWKGLIETVNHPAGTAYHAGFPQNVVAGKTGTAQVVSLDKHKKNTKFDHHAWFVGFWPLNPKPKYSIVVQVEHGGSGGKVAAPIAAEFIRSVNGQ